LCGMLSMSESSLPHLPQRAFADFVMCLEKQRVEKAAVRAAASAKMLYILSAGLELHPDLQDVHATLLGDFDLRTLRASGLTVETWWGLITTQINRMLELQVLFASSVNGSTSPLGGTPEITRRSPPILRSSPGAGANRSRSNSLNGNSLALAVPLAPLNTPATPENDVTSHPSSHPSTHSGSPHKLHTPAPWSRSRRASKDKGGSPSDALDDVDEPDLATEHVWSRSLAALLAALLSGRRCGTIEAHAAYAVFDGLPAADIKAAVLTLVRHAPTDNDDDDGECDSSNSFSMAPTSPTEDTTPPTVLAHVPTGCSLLSRNGIMGGMEYGAIEYDCDMTNSKMSFEMPTDAPLLLATTQSFTPAPERPARAARAATEPAAATAAAAAAATTAPAPATIHLSPGGRSESAQKRRSRYLRFSKEASEEAEDADPMCIPMDDIALSRRVGAGGFSTTYKATWSAPASAGTVAAARTVAVKVACSSSSDSLDQWRVEIRTLASLAHPNIVRYLGYVAQPPNYCLVLEFCEGGDLHDALRRGPTPNGFFLMVACGVVSALVYLHSRRLLHRDIKSGNVLMARGEDGDRDVVVPKLTDFGVAVELPDCSTSRRAHCLTAETGTYRWMAPEVIRHTPYSTGADLYSCAVVLYELVTHQVPWQGYDALQVAAAVALEDRRPPLPLDVPPPVLDLITRAWSTRAEDRPSAASLSRELSTLSERLTPEQTAWLDEPMGHAPPPDSPCCILSKRAPDGGGDAARGEWRWHAEQQGSGGELHERGGQREIASRERQSTEREKKCAVQ